MSRTINVNYNNRQIVISGQSSRTVPTNTFYTLGNDSNECNKNDNDNLFTEQQKHLRALDCMKDGMVGTNVANQVYPICYPELQSFDFTTLHFFEDKFTNCFANKIKKHAWTKISKESSLEPKFSKRTIFKESGLDAQYFIDNPQFCGDFANEIIDPAGRSPITSNDIVFPPNNITLNLSKDFLTFFGFKDCDLSATRISNSKYNYNISVPGFNITSPSNPLPSTNKTINWFQGNKEKNAFIRNDPNLQRIPNPTKKNIINGLFMTKEMGDVLQVLIMFVWSNLNMEQSYGMVTCDKVVFLLCMLLNLNCILTAATTDSKLKSKLRCIEFFEPKGYTIQDAKFRFNYEKNKIVEQNNKFIECINYLSNNSSINIYVSGVSTPFTFSNNFYVLLLTDVNQINQILIAQTVDSFTNPDDVDNFLEQIKSNFLLNMFIRDVQNKLKMTMAKKYTKLNFLWSSYNPAINPGTSSFFELARSRYIALSGGNLKKGLQRGGSRELNDQEFVIFSKLEFDNTPATFYDNYNNLTQNLYSKLIQEIRDYIAILAYGNYWDDFRNELYFNFYLNNEVSYDDDLKSLIQYIIANDLALPIPSTQIPQTMTSGINNITDINNINNITSLKRMNSPNTDFTKKTKVGGKKYLHKSRKTKRKKTRKIRKIRKTRKN